MLMFVTCNLCVEDCKKSGKNPANPVESGKKFQACNPVSAKMIQIRSGFGSYQNSRSGRTIGLSGWTLSIWSLSRRVFV